MKIQFTKEAFDKYQEEKEAGNKYALYLIKRGCCSYAITFDELFTSPETKLMDIHLPETDANGNVKYLPSGNMVPVANEVAEFTRSALIDYKTSGFKKTFKVYPNQIID